MFHEMWHNVGSLQGLHLTFWQRNLRLQDFLSLSFTSRLYFDDLRIFDISLDSPLPQQNVLFHFSVTQYTWTCQNRQ